jgi:hypothetical protein
MHSFAALAALALNVGTGAASELRSAVRASVASSNQCTCNLDWEGYVWPAITCGCSGACSGTCCYFSQPGQFSSLLSGCQCTDQTHNIFENANGAGGYATTCTTNGLLSQPPYVTFPGDSYYNFVTAGLPNPWYQSIWTGIPPAPSTHQPTLPPPTPQPTFAPAQPTVPTIPVEPPVEVLF